MCLDMIRMKLQPGAGARYSHPAQFVADCRLLFRNAYSYNPVLAATFFHPSTNKQPRLLCKPVPLRNV